MYLKKLSDRSKVIYIKKNIQYIFFLGLSPNIESASKKIHICSKIKHIQNISEDLDEMDNDENSITIQKALDSMNKSETKFSSSFMEKDNSLKRETWWLDDKFIKNFIFNPTCDEKTLEKHFKALHKDLIYSSFGLKQPKKEIKRKQVILCEKKG